MPFTLAHPAAVLPIRRFGILSALIVGSMIPDAFHFLPGMGESEFGHTLLGLLVFCLPAGLFCLWFFHECLKLPSMELLPKHHAEVISRVSRDFRFLPVGRLFRIVLSIFVGALTHLTWDSFTHDNGWAVQHWEILQGRVDLFPHYQIARSELLQDLSTLVGMLTVVLWYFLWFRRERPIYSERNVETLPVTHKSKPKLWFLFASAALAPALLAFVDNPMYWLKYERRAFVAFAIISGIKMLCVEIVVFSFWRHAQALSASRQGKWSR
ncbi:MAG: hypothetical protein JWO13_2498 [Acidobacteriales bacterium]|nr:hypothetical protein [Terriglobales bacterium]